MRVPPPLVTVVAFVLALGPADAAPLGAVSPAPLTSPSPQPCASVSPDQAYDIRTAFAYDLESPILLRFLTKLGAVPATEQKAIFAAAVAAATTPAETNAEAAIAATCENLDEVYATARARILVVNQWNLDALNDEKRADVFAEILRTAVSALSLGDRLAPDARTAALAPFAGLVAIPAPASRMSPGTCSATTAHTIHAAQPSFPQTALSAKTYGRVHVLVAISDAGDVRFAKLMNDTLHDRPGADEIIAASVYSAATTTYVSSTKNCVPYPSQYVFTADFEP